MGEIKETSFNIDNINSIMLYDKSLESEWKWLPETTKKVGGFLGLFKKEKRFEAGLYSYGNYESDGYYGYGGRLNYSSLDMKKYFIITHLHGMEEVYRKPFIRIVFNNKNEICKYFDNIADATNYVSRLRSLSKHTFEKINFD